MTDHWRLVLRMPGPYFLKALPTAVVVATALALTGAMPVLEYVDAAHEVADRAVGVALRIALALVGIAFLARFTLHVASWSVEHLR